MESNNIYQQLCERKMSGRKSFAVLVDPDSIDDFGALAALVNMSFENKVDYFFVGGSLITSNNLGKVIGLIKENSSIPVVLFPGNNMQIDANADAILFLSLISGRNPEYLIGQHVVAAPVLKNLNLEVLPTGYILVNSENPTTVSYMSNTSPIPADKPAVAACTALAGEMLGLQITYMDAGSGAKQPISKKMIAAVRKNTDTPLIIGGGINSVQKAESALEAGADVIVIGNAIEKDPRLLIDVSSRIHEINKSLSDNPLSTE